MDNKLATPAEALVCRANLMAKRREGSEESELFKQLAIHLSASLLATREACKERDSLNQQVVSGGDIPCPSCNRSEWLAFYRAEIIECGFEENERKRGPRTVKYGGFPELVRNDKKAMRKVKRWLRRGWYSGRKWNAAELRKEAGK